MIKAIPTQVDGINFRSKLEAHWYLVFKLSGLKPIYEPDAFVLEGICGGKVNYLPDFQITCGHKKTRFYVEIKPCLENQKEDIAKACILGYQKPCLIVIGRPEEYRAFVINKRRKGNPYGFDTFFSGLACVHEFGPVCLNCSYPDEDWLQLDDDDLNEVLSRPASDMGLIAKRCWNALQYQHRANPR